MKNQLFLTLIALAISMLALPTSAQEFNDTYLGYGIGVQSDTIDITTGYENEPYDSVIANLEGSYKITDHVALGVSFSSSSADNSYKLSNGISVKIDREAAYQEVTLQMSAPILNSQTELVTYQSIGNGEFEDKVTVNGAITITKDTFTSFGISLGIRTWISEKIQMGGGLSKSASSYENAANSDESSIGFNGTYFVLPTVSLSLIYERDIDNGVGTGLAFGVAWYL